MTLRADHVAGAFFIAFGALVFALSGDLPVGNLALPGSGFMPKILAGLMMLFGLILMVRAGESKPFATLSWHDAVHAALVVLITAAAIYLFEWLGFVLVNVLMMFSLLVVIERRKFIPAAAYSIGVVVVTYVLFVYALKTPLEPGPLGF
jgi:putative tricarboxylic transport membrane protein